MPRQPSSLIPFCMAVSGALICVSSTSPAAPPAAVPSARDRVGPLIDRHMAKRKSAVLKDLARGTRYPGLLKTPVRRKAFNDPWGAMGALEDLGLRIASASRRGCRGAGEILDILAAAIGKNTAGQVKPTDKRPATLDDCAGHIITLLDQAKTARDTAIAKVPAKHRLFLVKWAATMARNFGPQLPLNKQTLPLCNNDRVFLLAGHSQIDWRQMVLSAKILATLGDEKFLADVTRAAAGRKPIADETPGVTGQILLKKDTPHGLILIGGPGRNTYDLSAPLAVLIDVGGDDTYRGMVAATFDAEHPNSVVIDLGGHDVYEAKPMGLATGRFGVGILIDRDGDDTYKLADGSGGAAFAGIGILCDQRGNDTYVGSKHTQAAAFAGLALLLDLAGRDKYTSFGNALGFAGPGAAAALVDVDGNDSYQCGHKYPSGYNRSIKPPPKPGDRNFQYTAMGMGMGLGRRIMSREPKHQAYALAGGVGMLIDCAGDDVYNSSNFSQGCGYYFGAGLKLDLAGNDRHAGARYSHASTAHFGMGLFIDYGGRDTYTTTGPTYNCGCAWDHSVSLFIEAGGADDTYSLERSSGLGRGDIHSWGVAVETGGADTYKLPSGLGVASRDSLGAFYDHRGDDKYPDIAPKKGKPRNKALLTDADGGMFVDRAKAERQPAR